MSMLRAVMLTLGVFAVLFLGGVSAPASAAESAPPCHEAPVQPSSDHDPAKAPSVMACCIACVAAPTPAPMNEATVVHAAPPSPGAARAWVGRDPSPEPGPPRA